MKKIIFILGSIITSIGAINAQAPNAALEFKDSNISENSTVVANFLYDKAEDSQNFTDFVKTEGHTRSIVTENSSISSNRGVMSVSSYADRSLFEANYSETLVNEDFANGPGAGEILECGEIISSAGDGCFAAGVLVNGFNVTASDDETVYIGAGAIGNTSTLVGANVFIEFTVLSFDPNPAYAVGFDLFISANTNVDIRVYGVSNNLMETFNVTNTPETENFFGVISTDAIAKIEIETAGGELLGNLAFGTDANVATADCGGSNPNNGTFEEGLNCSAFAVQKVANDIIVLADEKFTLDKITANIWTYNEIVAVDVNYYEDNAGLPGALIGSQTSVDIISKAIIGTNFGYDIVGLNVSVNPFVFNGQVGQPTTYWIELSVHDDNSTELVFWGVTTSTMVNNATALYTISEEWEIYDSTYDGVYTFEGECNSLSVADHSLDGFSFYPNPTTNGIKLGANKNIESVSLFNLLGQQVITTSVDATSFDLNMDGLATGTYVMKVIVDGQIGTYKVIKN